MKVLFAGLGSIGRRHLRLLRERPASFDVVAYRSRQGTSPAPDGVTSVYDLDAALETGPDVAFVTNPTACHVETALACARAGCDLFVEKPLSDSMAGVDELCSEARERDLVTAIGCQLRYHPVLRELQSVLESGDLGPVHSFDITAGSYLPDWRPDQDYRDSYSADPDLGGGVVLDLIHELDYAHWLLGPCEVLAAHVDRISHLEIDSEDLAEIVLDAAGDTVGRVHLDYYRRSPRREIEVVCRDGNARADLVADELRVETPESVEQRSFDHERDDAYREQLDAFLTAVEAREPYDNDLEEGRRVLELGLAARAKG